MRRVLVASDMSSERALTADEFPLAAPVDMFFAAIKKFFPKIIHPPG